MFTSLTSRFMGGLRGTLGGIRVIAPARIKNLLWVKEGCLGLYDLRTMSCSRLQCGMKKQARIPLWPKWQYWLAGLGVDWNLSEGKWRGADSLWQRWGLVASPEDCKSQPGPQCKRSRISSLSRLICHQSRCTAWAECSHVRLMIREGFLAAEKEKWAREPWLKGNGSTLIVHQSRLLFRGAGARLQRCWLTARSNTAAPALLRMTGQTLSLS